MAAVVSLSRSPGPSGHSPHFLMYGVQPRDPLPDSWRAKAVANTAKTPLFEPTASRAPAKPTGPVPAKPAETLFATGMFPWTHHTTYEREETEEEEIAHQKELA